MLRASLIGLATAAALTAGASTASAGGLDVDVHFGGYGYPYPVYSPYPAYFNDYDDDCHWIKTKKWVKKNGHWKKIYVKKMVCY